MSRSASPLKVRRRQANAAGVGTTSALGPPLEDAVRRMFRALDSHDATSFRRVFAPGARIVHDDGVETTVDTVARRIRTGSAVAPRARRLSRFRFGGSGNWAWITYRNHIRFTAGGRTRTIDFSEIALLRRGQDFNWRIMHIQYSGNRGAAP